jgi:hypothetical protein
MDEIHALLALILSHSIICKMGEQTPILEHGGDLTEIRGGEYNAV